MVCSFIVNNATESIPAKLIVWLGEVLKNDNTLQQMGTFGALQSPLLQKWVDG